MAISAHNDHNVYVLGAGFSADAGLPLIKDFMNRMRDALAWLVAQEGRGREVEAIERVLRFRLEATGAAYRVPLDVDNVEELFSLASASGDEALAQAMTLAIAATLDYTRAVAAAPPSFHVAGREAADFTPPPSWGPPPKWMQNPAQSAPVPGDWRWYSCPRYDFYLGVMAGYFDPGGPDRRDTVISFNYDMVIEEALGDLGLTFQYAAAQDVGWSTPSALREAQRASERLHLLKLHGSVNWCEGAEHWAAGGGELAGVPQGVVSELGRRIAAFPSYRELRERGCSPLLVAPTWQKVLRGYLASVWKEAVEALRTATRVVILGYSIPDTDQHFKYLLAAGLRDNISLRKIFFVNPQLGDENARRRFEARLFGLLRREHFERGVIEFVPVNTQAFLAGPKDRRISIGRPVNPAGSSFETAHWLFDGPGETSIQ